MPKAPPPVSVHKKPEIADPPQHADQQTFQLEQSLVALCAHRKADPYFTADVNAIAEEEAAAAGRDDPAQGVMISSSVL